MCPDDNQLNAFIEGVLVGDDHTAFEAHLDECEKCRALVLAAGAVRAELSSARLGLPQDDAPEALAPTRIGRFQVARLLGEGAMGRTWLAYDPELDRQVCLKLLKSAPTDYPAAERDRLLKEARAQARLSHPAIVSVYEVVTEGNVVALAMQFLEGTRSLRSWLDEKRSTEEILAALAQAGQGLAAAHASGVVHRDFKPDNVLMTPDGQAKIIDFGLARHLVELPTAVAIPRQTHARTVAAGTPAYMAPEQFRGEPGDARSDQYSFCVTLYEALCGRRPFAYSTLAAQLAAQRNDAPPKPVQPMPAHVWNVLVRGLSPNRAERFESMAHLLGALHPVFVKRSRAGQWVAAAAVTAAVAFAAVWAWPRPAPLQPMLPTPVPTPSAQTILPSAAARAVVEPPSPSVTQPIPVTTIVPKRSIQRGAPRLAMAPVSFDVKPQVSVRFKGKILGTTPGVFELPLGHQQVELINESLSIRQTRTLRVTAGMPQVTFEFQKGELEVRSSPWAYVSIDGKPLGSTPVPIQQLYEGSHAILLERPDLGVRALKQVLVVRGERQVLRHVLDETGPDPER